LLAALCHAADNKIILLDLLLRKKNSMYLSGKKEGILLLLCLLLSVPLFAQPTGSDAKPAVPASAQDVQPLKQGSTLPPILLTTANGSPVALDTFLKQQPVVLVFYRGGWCPYCNTHLRELIDADSALRALGYQILAVSPDRPQKLAESIAQHALSYTLLSDSAMVAAQAFGVAFQVEESTVTRYKQNGLDLEEASGTTHHLLPVPSVFIIDQQGVIRYVYYNADIKTRLSARELVREAALLNKRP
jgi:peroxiredoxin